VAEKDNQTNRRSVLKSIGAAGAAGLAGSGTVSALSDADGVKAFGDVRSETSLDREIKIEATGQVRYTVGVTGLLGADGVTDGTVSNTITDETDAIRFTGEFTELSVDGDARVLVDGEEFDVAAFPENTLEIVPDGTVTYDVSASGAVSVDRGSADQPNARTATAETSEPHRLSYAGELTYFNADGDVTLRRNGSSVSADQLLPSTHSHGLTTAAGDTSYTVDVARGMELADGTNAAPDETVTTTGQTSARYSGSFQAVEHENGTRVEVDELRNEIVVSGPRAGETEVRLKTTRGLVVNHEAFDEAVFRLSAGEEATAAPHGDIQRVVVGDVTFRLSQDAYPEATDSMALQTAAEMERTTEFRRLEGFVEGRIRHDAAGIAGEVAFDSDRTLVRSVEHALVDPKQGDRGIVSVRQQSGTVDHAGVRYIASKGEEVVIESNTFPTTGTRGEVETERVASKSLQREKTTQKHDRSEFSAATFAGTATPSADVTPSDLGPLADKLSREQLQSQGFLSLLNDLRDLYSQGINNVYQITQTIYSVAKDQLDELAVTAESLLVSSPELICDLADELKDSGLSNADKVAWKIAMAPGIQLYNLQSAGFFEAIEVGAGCASCVFFAILFRDVIASEGASYLCIYVAPAIVIAAVGCVIVVEAAIQFFSNYVGYSDVKDELCAGEIIQQIDHC
jgi:hypothetical protein